METEPTISFRNMDSSPAVADLIRRRISELERFSSRLVGCDVVVEAAHGRKHNARGFSVRVNLHLPGPDISVSREVAQGDAQNDVILALNKAFTAAEKRLKEQGRKMGAQEVKHHAEVRHGRITEIELELGYGTVEADDGREVYFQRDSLESGEWRRLRKGMRLRFREEQGEKGPYATHVSPLAGMQDTDEGT